MKTLYGYAIVAANDKLDCWDYQMPIYWRKKVALDEMRKNSFEDSKVVKVSVTPVKKGTP